MIRGLAQGVEGLRKVNGSERLARFGHRSFTLWLTGRNAVEAAYQLERALFDLGHASYVLDDPSQVSNAALIASHVNKAGLICLCVVSEPPSADGLVLSSDEFCVDEGMKTLMPFLRLETPGADDFDI